MIPSPHTKTRLNWRHDETIALLKSWKEHQHINRLIKKGCSKHPLYYAISKDLQKAGFERSVKEISFKMRNLISQFRSAKLTMPVNGETDFKYFREVDEIMKMEAGTKNNSPQITPEQPEIVDESYIERNSPEDVQVIRLIVPDNEDTSESEPHSYTVISHVEPEVRNESHLQSSSERSSENILLNFYQEFERSNRQLEKNDAAMLELFKEQNDIFRTQTTLLMKLLLK